MKALNFLTIVLLLLFSTSAFATGNPCKYHPSKCKPQPAPQVYNNAIAGSSSKAIAGAAAINSNHLFNKQRQSQGIISSIKGGNNNIKVNPTISPVINSSISNSSTVSTTINPVLNATGGTGHGGSASSSTVIEKGAVKGGSATIDEGAVSNSNNIHEGAFQNSVELNNYERIQHVVPQSSQNCVRGTCAATSSFVITGGYDEATGNSVNLGVVIPFGGGSGMTTKAMKYQTHQINMENVHLRQQMLHERESHQAQMVSMCVQMHKMLSRVEGNTDKHVVLVDDTHVRTDYTRRDSNDIWARCAGFQHLPGAVGKHGDFGGDRAQYMPHGNQH